MGAEQQAAVAAWEALFRAQSVLFERFSASPVWHGRSVKEYDVLYQLSRASEQGMRQRDLARALMISQPSISRILDRFVADGLLVRLPDPSDGRGGVLRLTEAGHALQRRIGAGHAADVASSMRERLSDAELQQLRELTARLVAPECGGDLHAAGRAAE